MSSRYCEPSKFGFTWVIDPMDGIANFMNGILAWVVVTEAEGVIGLQSANAMIENGCEVIVGVPGIFEKLLEISRKAKMLV